MIPPVDEDTGPIPVVPPPTTPVPPTVGPTTPTDGPPDRLDDPALVHGPASGVGGAGAGAVATADEGSPARGWARLGRQERTALLAGVGVGLLLLAIGVPWLVRGRADGTPVIESSPFDEVLELWVDEPHLRRAAVRCARPRRRGPGRRPVPSR